MSESQEFNRAMPGLLAENSHLPAPEGREGDPTNQTRNQAEDIQRLQARVNDIVELGLFQDEANALLEAIEHHQIQTAAQQVEPTIPTQDQSDWLLAIENLIFDQGPQLQEAVNCIREAAPDLIAFQNQSWRLEVFNGHQIKAAPILAAIDRHRNQSAQLLAAFKRQLDVSTNPTSEQLPPLSSTMQRIQDDVIKVLEDFNCFQNQAVPILKAIVRFQDLKTRVTEIFKSFQVEPLVLEDFIRFQRQLPLSVQPMNDHQNPESSQEE